MRSALSRMVGEEMESEDCKTASEIKERREEGRKVRQ
jgi:hypothetical protein